MAVAFRSASTPQTGTTSLTFTAPSGEADGDILIANIYAEKNADTNTLSTIPSGFTEWGRVTETGVDPDIHQYVLWWRKSGALTYTFGKSGAAFMAGDLIAVSGAITSGDPKDVFGSFAQATSGTSLTATSITATVANTLLVYCAGSFNGTNLTSDGAMTERSDSNSSCIDTQAIAATGATGTRAATTFNNAWTAVLVNIQPDTGAAGQPTTKRFGGVEFFAGRGPAQRGMRQW